MRSWEEQLLQPEGLVVQEDLEDRHRQEGRRQEDQEVLEVQHLVQEHRVAEQLQRALVQLPPRLELELTLLQREQVLVWQFLL